MNATETVGGKLTVRNIVGSFVALFVILLTIPFGAPGQTLKIIDVKIAPDGRLVIEHTSDTNSAVSVKTTISGTFTAVVSASDLNGAGTYSLQLTEASSP